MMRGGGGRMRLRKIWCRRRNIYTGWRWRWSRRGRCSSRRELRRGSTCRGCCWRMRAIRRGRSRRRRGRGRRIRGRRRSIKWCLRNKKMIRLMKWNWGRRELRNLWIRWPIMFFRKWGRNKKMKMICSWDMKMKRRRDKDNLKNVEQLDKKMNKNACVTF